MQEMDSKEGKISEKWKTGKIRRKIKRREIKKDNGTSLENPGMKCGAEKKELSCPPGDRFLISEGNKNRFSPGVV